MSNLFTQPPDPPKSLPHNGTATSKGAAQVKQASGTADTDRNRIVVYLFHHPEGATRQQLHEALNIGVPSVCGRTNLLVEEGILVEVGTRKYDGRPASKVLVHRVHVDKS